MALGGEHGQGDHHLRRPLVVSHGAHQQLRRLPRHPGGPLLRQLPDRLLEALPGQQVECGLPSAVARRPRTQPCSRTSEGRQRIRDRRQGAHHHQRIARASRLDARAIEGTEEEVGALGPHKGLEEGQQTLIAPRQQHLLHLLPRHAEPEVVAPEEFGVGEGSGEEVG